MHVRMHALDDTDRRLLRLLQDEPELAVTELASRAGLSAGPCARRIERLERDGVILGRAIEIDWRALGFEVQVFLRITLDKTHSNAFDAFLAAARALPEVVAIETLLGRVDVRMDVIARDLAHYQEIYRNRILALPHIAEIEALMLVSELKNSERLPI
jgi:Lrp/AsnC family transcriptional regulator